MPRFHSALRLALGCTILSLLPQISGCAQQPPTPTRCSSTQLKLKTLREDAGMGHRALGYVYTNISHQPCTLDGYPRITPLNKVGQPVTTVPVTPARQGYFSPRRKAKNLTLAPGEQAWFVLGYSVIPHGDAACPRVSGLRIGLPGANGNTTRDTRVTHHMAPCDGLHVLPLQRGKPAY